MRRRLATLALFAALLSPLVARSTVLLDWSVEELTRRADLIVIATVISKRSFSAEGTIMTTTRLRIERTLLGANSAEVEVLQLGGQLGDRIVDVPGDAELRLGKTYVLFTAQPLGQPYRSLVGMALGAHEVKGEALTQSVDVPLLGPRGEIRPAPGPRTTTLKAVLRTIQEVRR